MRDVQKLVEIFKQKCDNPTIVKCYENKLLYGCTYHPSIEEKIKEDPPPWWIDHLD